MISQHLEKIRKESEICFTLSSSTKTVLIDEKIRTLNTHIKKLLTKKDATVEIFVMKGKAD